MSHSVDSIETSERSATAVSTKIVQRIATVPDQNVTQLPPLYDVIDPEALDTVVDSAKSAESSLTVQLTYSGHQITVDESGAVSVTPGDR